MYEDASESWHGASARNSEQALKYEAYKKRTAIAALKTGTYVSGAKDWTELPEGCYSIISTRYVVRRGAVLVHTSSLGAGEKVVKIKDPDELKPGRAIKILGHYIGKRGGKEVDISADVTAPSLPDPRGTRRTRRAGAKPREQHSHYEEDAPGFFEDDKKIVVTFTGLLTPSMFTTLPSENLTYTHRRQSDGDFEGRYEWSKAGSVITRDRIMHALNMGAVEEVLVRAKRDDGLVVDQPLEPVRVPRGLSHYGNLRTPLLEERGSVSTWFIGLAGWGNSVPRLFKTLPVPDVWDIERQEKGSKFDVHYVWSTSNLDRNALMHALNGNFCGGEEEGQLSVAFSASALRPLTRLEHAGCACVFACAVLGATVAAGAVARTLVVAYHWAPTMAELNALAHALNGNGPKPATQPQKRRDPRPAQNHNQRPRGSGKATMEPKSGGETPMVIKCVQPLLSTGTVRPECAAHRHRKPPPETPAEERKAPKPGAETRLARRKTVGCKMGAECTEPTHFHDVVSVHHDFPEPSRANDNSQVDQDLGWLDACFEASEGPQGWENQDLSWLDAYEEVAEQTRLASEHWDKVEEEEAKRKVAGPSKGKEKEGPVKTPEAGPSRKRAEQKCQNATKPLVTGVSLRAEAATKQNKRIAAPPETAGPDGAPPDNKLVLKVPVGYDLKTLWDPVGRNWHHSLHKIEDAPPDPEAPEDPEDEPETPPAPPPPPPGWRPEAPGHPEPPIDTVGDLAQPIRDGARRLRLRGSAQRHALVPRPSGGTYAPPPEPKPIYSSLVQELPSEAGSLLSHYVGPALFTGWTSLIKFVLKVIITHSYVFKFEERLDMRLLPSDVPYLPGERILSMQFNKSPKETGPRIMRYDIRSRLVVTGWGTRADYAVSDWRRAGLVSWTMVYHIKPYAAKQNSDASTLLNIASREVTKCSDVPLSAEFNALHSVHSHTAAVVCIMHGHDRSNTVRDREMTFWRRTLPFFVTALVGILLACASTFLAVRLGQKLLCVAAARYETAPCRNWLWFARSLVPKIAPPAHGRAIIYPVPVYDAPVPLVRETAFQRSTNWLMWACTYSGAEYPANDKDATWPRLLFRSVTGHNLSSLQHSLTAKVRTVVTQAVRLDSMLGSVQCEGAAPPPGVCRTPPRSGGLSPLVFAFLPATYVVGKCLSEGARAIGNSVTAAITKKKVPLMSVKLEKTLAGYRIDDAGLEYLAAPILDDGSIGRGMNATDPRKNFVFEARTTKHNGKGHGSERPSAAGLTNWRIPGICMYMPDLSYPLNQATGTAHRVARLTPTMDPAVKAAMKAFVTEEMKAYKPITSFTPVRELIAKLDKPQAFKDILLQAHDTEPQRFRLTSTASMRRDQYTIAAAGKYEYYEEPKFMRNVFGQARVTLEADTYGWAGAITKDVERCFYEQTIGHVKGMTPQQRMERIKEICHPSSRNTLSDYSSYEASMGEDVYDCILFPLYERLLSGMPSDFRSVFHAANRRLYTDLNVKFNKKSPYSASITASIDNLEPSGIPGTAHTNFSVNHFVWKKNLVDKGLSPIQADQLGLKEGDDTVWSLHGIRFEKEDFAKYGLVVKMDQNMDNAESAFCQLHPLNESNGIITNPQKFLAKFFMLRPCDMGLKPSGLLAVYKAKAMSAACLYKGAPIITPFCERVLLLLRHITASERLLNREAKYGYEKSEKQEVVAVTAEARATVEQLWSWTTPMQLHAEAIIANWVGGPLLIPPQYFPESYQQGVRYLRDADDVSSPVATNTHVQDLLLEHLSPHARTPGDMHRLKASCC
jgi:hypothetical protein